MDFDRLERLGRDADQQPDHPEAWLALAEALLDHRAPELARPILARARASELDHTGQWKHLAELALRLGDRSTARQALRTTVGLDEDDVDAVSLFARLALEDGEADEAVPVLKKSLARQDHPDLRRWLVQAVGAARSSSSSDLRPPSSSPNRKRGLAMLTPGSSSFTGDLTVSSLPEMLEFLAQQRSSGTLQVLSKQHSANMHLSDGRITEVDHPRRPSLVALLSDRGRSFAARLRELPIEVTIDERALREAVVREGLVDPETLRDVLRKRIEDGIFEILQWDQSYAQFRAGPTITEEEGFDTHWLMLTVLQRLDEHAAKASSAPQPSDEGS